MEERNQPNFNQNSEEDLSLILKIACVIIPLVGLILFFVEKNKNPKKSKSACYFALGGVVLSIIVNILVTMLVSH